MIFREYVELLYQAYLQDKGYLQTLRDKIKSEEFNKDQMYDPEFAGWKKIEPRGPEKYLAKRYRFHPSSYNPEQGVYTYEDKEVDTTRNRSIKLFGGRKKSKKQKIDPDSSVEHETSIISKDMNNTNDHREAIRSKFRAIREKKELFNLFEEWMYFLEDTSFYIYRTDTNAVLATGINGFEAAKRRASELRKSLGLKFDEVKFKSERSRAQGTIGVSGDGRTFTDSKGERHPVKYAKNYNPSKRGRFRGYYDKQGNYYDID